MKQSDVFVYLIYVTMHSPGSSSWKIIQYVIRLTTIVILLMGTLFPVAL